MSKTVPAQKPGTSKQDYQTPSELIHAIGVDFSAIARGGLGEVQRRCMAKSALRRH